ncbi:arylesterase [Hyphomicrobium sp. CS1GBMeth3]|uniref:arylesterase n=1 Tax=Hyphomicrobium sp. CS1GBMeth3 TaxID=1892845 RepID=UPI000930F70E|nr:arylesterase [Hyphomicrobium sp. CS1GBMeth3]
MKAKQGASTFLRHMVRWMALVNLWLAASVGGAMAADEAAPVRIVAFGDSLTAGYMLAPSEAFPEQLAKALKAKGHAVEIANAGVSGDTTAAGLERFDWAIPEGTEAVIVELGANDALRGIDPDVTRANLDTILTKIRGRNIDVLIAGMRAPKNYGKDYEVRYESIFSDLAEKHGALLYPFFLEGVAMDAKLNMQDGLHPTGPGVGVIVEGILHKVEELIGRVRERRTDASKS